MHQHAKKRQNVRMYTKEKLAYKPLKICRCQQASHPMIVVHTYVNTRVFEWILQLSLSLCDSLRRVVGGSNNVLGGRVLVIMRVWEGPENVVFAAHSRALQLTPTRLTLLQAANAVTLHPGHAIGAPRPILSAKRIEKHRMEVRTEPPRTV